jgi:hypothetical protein
MPGESQPGEYQHPQGYLAYVSQLPFLGRLRCATQQLEAGSWQEILLDYEVGAVGLADGAWLKITFKFYSDWALFQTEDPQAANYVSVEYQARPPLTGESQATVQALLVRFDQKGHERPFQKAILIDILDGYLKPGDHLQIRLGDRRAGGPGTRVQTFVEQDFRLRAFIDPVGASRFAAIPGDVSFDIIPGAPAQLVTIAPRLVRAGQSFPLRVRVEDRWGNTCRHLGGNITLICPDLSTQVLAIPQQGWAVVKTELTLEQPGEQILQASLENSPLTSACPITVDPQFAFARAWFADLHVHSNSTVGTNSTEYNLSYGRDVAGLDVLGYTANDFNITEKQWHTDVALCQALTESGQFLCYPGTEWCGNSAAGGDRNVVFLGEEILFPRDRQGQMVRSFEWNDAMTNQALQPGAYPVDRLFAAYAHDPEQFLLIPHVGGRRAILDWHHPSLERLIEVGSSWGHFPWFYQEAIERGYKIGAAASGDEHRGRCGGGVPGTAVFGVKGGVTGILAPELTKLAINHALRARHTWATTGERLVGLLWTEQAIQGDEYRTSGPLTCYYRLLGDTGWDEVAAYTHAGLLWQRQLQAEQGFAPNRIRLRWGGARIKDRYRAAQWRGQLDFTQTLVLAYQATGLEHSEEYVRRKGPLTLEFRSDTYGDSDAIELEVSDLPQAQFRLQLELDSYTKVGNPLQRHPDRHCPQFEWSFSGAEILAHAKLRQDLGGTDLFVSVERMSGALLPRELTGSFILEPQASPFGFVPVYLFARQVDDAKVWTSPLFIEFCDSDAAKTPEPPA